MVNSENALQGAKQYLNQAEKAIKAGDAGRAMICLNVIAANIDTALAVMGRRECQKKCTPLEWPELVV